MHFPRNIPQSLVFYCRPFKINSLPHPRFHIGHCIFHPSPSPACRLTGSVLLTFQTSVLRPSRRCRFGFDIDVTRSPSAKGEWGGGNNGHSKFYDADVLIIRAFPGRKNAVPWAIGAAGERITRHPSSSGAGRAGGSNQRESGEYHSAAIVAL